MPTRARCFLCDRPLGRNPTLVTCQDEQDVFVGRECVRLIQATGAAGYQPPTGPRLYALKHDPKGAGTFEQLCARMDAAHAKKNARTL